MNMDSEALRGIAANLESMNSKSIQLNQSFSSVLENMLLEVFAKLQPEPREYEERRHLVDTFNDMAIEVFGDQNDVTSVEAFGSFIMNLFSAASDLDLSINFSNDAIELPRPKKISIIRKFAKFLYAHQKKGKVNRVSPILSARVPVLKVVDRETRIECDISVENKDGVARSMIFSVISLIDERFRILSYLMKAWARNHGINSAKDKTMNSLTIISLVAFHLQTRNPPILPPFSALLEDGMDVSRIEEKALHFKEFSKRNQESVVELFITLFTKLSSIQNLWQQGLCVSLYEGSWISKTWKSRIGKMSVEDFSDQSQNFARSVGNAGIQKINKCIQDSQDHLLCFMRGEFDASKLQDLLFGSLDVIAEKSKNRKKGKKPHKKRPLHSVAPDDPSTKSITESATKGAIKGVKNKKRQKGKMSHKNRPFHSVALDDPSMKSITEIATEGAKERIKNDTHEGAQTTAISERSTTENATKGAIERIKHDAHEGAQTTAISKRSTTENATKGAIERIKHDTHEGAQTAAISERSTMENATKGAKKRARHDTHLRGQATAISKRSTMENASKGAKKRARYDTHLRGQAPAYHYNPGMSLRPPGSSLQSQSSDGQASAYHCAPLISFRPSVSSLQSWSTSGQAPAYHYTPTMPSRPSVSSFQLQSNSGKGSAYHYTPTMSSNPLVFSLRSQSGSGQAFANHFAPTMSFRPSASQSNSGQTFSAHHYTPMMPFAPTVSSLQSQSSRELYGLRPSVPVQGPPASNYIPASFPHPVYGSGHLLSASQQHSSDFMPAACSTHINHDYRNQYDQDHMTQGRYINHDYRNHMIRGPSYDSRRNFWPR